MVDRPYLTSKETQALQKIALLKELITDIQIRDTPCKLMEEQLFALRTLLTRLTHEIFVLQDSLDYYH
jgi:hypothetical protein